MASKVERISASVLSNDTEELSLLLGVSVTLIERIGADTGFLSQVFLLSRPSPLPRLVIKVPLVAAEYQQEAAEHFRSEVDFYNQLFEDVLCGRKEGEASEELVAVTKVKGEKMAHLLRYIPHCFSACWDNKVEQGFILLSEIKGGQSLQVEKPGEPGSTLTEDSIKALLDWLGNLHSLGQGQTSQGALGMKTAKSILQTLQTFLSRGEKYQVASLQVVNEMHALSADLRAIAEKLLDNAVEALDWVKDNTQSLDAATFLHGDIWSNNILVDEEGDLKGVIDFQFTTSGDSGLLDFVCLESLSLPTAYRREKGAELLLSYLSARGVKEEEEVERGKKDYAAAVLFGVLFCLVSCVVFPQEGETRKRTEAYITDKADLLLAFCEK